MPSHAHPCTCELPLHALGFHLTPSYAVTRPSMHMRATPTRPWVPHDAHHLCRHALIHAHGGTATQTKCTLAARCDWCSLSVLMVAETSPATSIDCVCSWPKHSVSDFLQRVRTRNCTIVFLAPTGLSGLVDVHASANSLVFFPFVFTCLAGGGP